MGYLCMRLKVYVSFLEFNITFGSEIWGWSKHEENFTENKKTGAAVRGKESKNMTRIEILRDTRKQRMNQQRKEKKEKN